MAINNESIETAAYSAPPGEGGCMSNVSELEVEHKAKEFQPHNSHSISYSPQHAVLRMAAELMAKMDVEGENKADQRHLRTVLRSIAQMYGIPTKGKD